LMPAGMAVGTVGHLRIEPNASNVIPGHVSFSVDIRSLDDELRRALVKTAVAEFGVITNRRRLTLALETLSEAAATRCAPALVETIRATLTDMELPSTMLSSGAGHDGIAMSSIGPTGMIFMRCLRGVSHHPAESVSLGDLVFGIEALDRTCRKLAQQSGKLRRIAPTSYVD